MRPLRAHSMRAGGYHWCAACQGSGSCTCRVWTRKGWRIESGRCQMCRGRGGRFQNHEPIGRGAMSSTGSGAMRRKR